jgi:RHS repeat-associated protein
MTRLTVAEMVAWEDRYPAKQNNGLITQMKDWVSGEEVTCQHDALNRLVSAETTGAGWGQTYGYDGFGNLVAQTVTKGTAPSLAVVVDPATNRLVGASYDANGNLLWSGYSYDVENRLLAAPWEEYAYDGNHRRVWKRKRIAEDEYRQEVYFYGVGGERLGTYRLVRHGAALAFETVADNLYFNGRLIRSGREVVAVDRLGSVRWRRNLDTGAEQRFDYWPYGQEKPQATVQEREKFGTYYRDATGLDYADQRYYVSHWGRFLTADPFVTATALRNPTRGWNRYAYVEGDPVNFWGPAGLFIAVPGSGDPPPPSVPWNLHIFPTLQDFVGAPGALLMLPAFWAGEDGGASMPTAEERLLEASLRRLVDRPDEECARAIGAQDAATARAALRINIGFADLGSLRVITASDGRVVRAQSDPPVAQYRPGVLGIGRAVRLNTRVNWLDPDRTLAVDQNGGVVAFPLLTAKARQLEIASMTAGEFPDLTLLHELSHRFGLRHPDTDSRALDQEIWRECFQ